MQYWQTDANLPADLQGATLNAYSSNSSTYVQTRNFFRGAILRRKVAAVHAVSDVSFSVPAGTTFGLVGESGCGKTTIGKMIVALERPNSGAVTLGGVDTNELSSKTMEARHVPGLYFIGEVVDVTGHLGGFNFQWAWASGFVAGQYA